MNKVLLYENRKEDPVVWDASSPELEEKAFRSLFNKLDEEYNFYAELRKADVNHLYKKAVKGDFKSIKKILTSRINYEYEYWSLINIHPYIE